jgi:hypothetical protein
MNADIHLEHRAGSSQGKHEGEPSLGLCDRLNRTRDNSQRQLPTDHDYAVPTREYQIDQSSLKTAPTAARSVFGKGKQRQRQKQPHCCVNVDTVTPYQAISLIETLLVAHPSSSLCATINGPSVPLRGFGCNFCRLFLEGVRLGRPRRGIAMNPVNYSSMSSISINNKQRA